MVRQTKCTDSLLPFYTETGCSRCSNERQHATGGSFYVQQATPCAARTRVSQWIPIHQGSLAHDEGGITAVDHRYVVWARDLQFQQVAAFSECDKHII